MNSAEHTVLDHIDNIVVPGCVFEPPANEYWALVCLQHGMHYLYRQACQCDNAVKQRVNPNDNRKYFGLGNVPEFQGIPKALLTCSFHWYAISACNYVRTVGAIAYRQDPKKRPNPSRYVEKVIPEVLAFRNKVAAHFAWSTTNNRDNDAERLVSIMPQLAFTNDSFHVAALSCTLRKAGKESTSETIQAWSICKVHEELQKRYWPREENKSKS